MISDVTYDATLAPSIAPSIAETSLRAVFFTHGLTSALTTIKWVTSFVTQNDFLRASEHKLSVEKPDQAYLIRIQNEREEKGYGKDLFTIQITGGLRFFLCIHSVIRRDGKCLAA